VMVVDSTGTFLLWTCRAKQLGACDRTGAR
jgi:hypothetical protein